MNKRFNRHDQWMEKVPGSISVTGELQTFNDKWVTFLNFFTIFRAKICYFVARTFCNFRSIKFNLPFDFYFFNSSA